MHLFFGVGGQGVLWSMWKWGIGVHYTGKWKSRNGNPFVKLNVLFLNKVNVLCKN